MNDLYLNEYGRYSPHKNPTALKTRLLRHVAYVGLCWMWMGQEVVGGYGRIRVEGRLRMAYRISYEVFVGPIPEGLTIDHLCRQPRCINPAHLQPKPLRDNILEGNNPCAINARKTHCAKCGEELVHTDKARTRRGCRSCLRIRARENTRRYRERQKLREN